MIDEKCEHTANDNFFGESQVSDIWIAYLITFGWAIVGSVSMAIGIVIALKIFDLATPQIDEWKLIGEGNLAVAIVISTIVASVALVIAASIG